MRGNLREKPHLGQLPERRIDLLRKHQNGLRENDRHDARVIDPQRHERSPAGINLATDRPLGILHRDLPLRLSDRDHARDDAGQQEHQCNGVGDVLAFDPLAREEHVIHTLPSRRQAVPECRW